MENPPTCGRGLAEHAALPAALGALTASVADVLELHTTALDLTDENSRKERDAYLDLVERHRETATQLLATAAQMAGYRDLPMGRHDLKAMSAPTMRETFEKFVRLERELLALLQTRVERDRQMLVAMGGTGGAG